MKKLLLLLAVFILPGVLLADVLSAPKTCMRVDTGTGKPSGCKKTFKASDKIHVYSKIQTRGAYKINARFELQDNTRRNKPITVDVQTQDDWDYVYFWMTPKEHDDKFVGTWKIIIYAHDETGNTTTTETTFEVKEAK
ncbi:MAG: hypothetical protein K8S54_14340 [Spirochaetia bacterium]|nr:hypothetical protein [Spirochaetia bacterium]